MRAELGAALAGLLCWLAAPPSAQAYCRTTTCNPDRESCALNVRGCVIDGLPVFWRTPCITLWLPDESEPLPGIDHDAFARAVVAGFKPWRDVDCGHGGRAIDVRLGGALECALTGYDENASANINTVRVVRDEWMHRGVLTQVALTTVTSLVATGEILDADIEINAVDNEFTLGADGDGTDLLSALTHEAGHALGLAHSDDPDATMYWRTRGGTGLRTLNGDDEAGLCETYPEPLPAAACGGAASDPAEVCLAVATPRAVGRSNGCSASAGRPSGITGYGLLLLAAAASVRRSRRRS